ncbi:MAG: glycosyltransferase family 2 protein [Pirellulales bacterium]|nr:glycosyltransferase family 2 protein [Pirellulales bacterium]
MPVRNEEAHIGRTLAQVLDQRRDGIELEVCVVDGRSSDRTREVVSACAARHPEVTLLDNPLQLSSAARNVAILRGRGDYFVVIDGHCEIPSRTYFTDLVEAFESSDADCLGRPQPLEVAAASSLQRAIAAARASRLGHHPDSFIYSNKPQVAPAFSVGVAYRRRVFEVVGLFDEQFDACEDCEFNYRVDQAGLRCLVDPRLTVNYQPRNSLARLFRQLVRYGRGRVRMARKHPATASWKSFAPAAFVSGVIAGPLACVPLPLLWRAYLPVVGAYLAVVAAASCAIAWRRKEFGLLWLLPPTFMAIHFGAGGGALAEWCSGRSPGQDRQLGSQSVSPAIWSATL